MAVPDGLRQFEEEVFPAELEEIRRRREELGFESTELAGPPSADLGLQGIRTTYDGPLTLAHDMMVWNVTKDDIRVRQIVFNEDVWTAPVVNRGEIDTSLRESESDFIKSGRADMGDIIQQIYDRANKMYGTDLKPGF